MSTVNDFARLQAVLHYVCKTFRITQQALFSRQRHEPVAFARQVALTLSYKETGLTAAEVGWMFGRTAGDVYYSVRAVANRVITNQHSKRIVDAVKRKVRNEKFG